MLKALHLDQCLEYAPWAKKCRQTSIPLDPTPPKSLTDPTERITDFPATRAQIWKVARLGEILRI